MHKIIVAANEKRLNLLCRDIAVTSGKTYDHPTAFDVGGPEA
jgi:hypothetical protein